ncbi:MAG: Lrp/AsnC family transcriptional regulator [Deltaproteobacteria bacterium]|nr:Lrp/AsnC family transcriptional regulator [Deltaproteobacteria bacterium]
MDKIDRNIIRALQENGRITNVELARMNDLAPSSMLERVRRLEEKGVIKGYCAILDPKAIGLEIQAMVMITLDRHQSAPIDTFENGVRSVPEVRGCYHLTGRYDYMLHVVARDIDHLGELVKHRLASIGGAEKLETFLVLSTIKEDHGFGIETMPKED